MVGKLHHIDDILSGQACTGLARITTMAVLFHIPLVSYIYISD